MLSIDLSSSDTCNTNGPIPYKIVPATSRGTSQCRHQSIVPNSPSESRLWMFPFHYAAPCLPAHQDNNSKSPSANFVYDTGPGSMPVDGFGDVVVSNDTGGDGTGSYWERTYRQREAKDIHRLEHPGGPK